MVPVTILNIIAGNITIILPNNAHLKEQFLAIIALLKEHSMVNPLLFLTFVHAVDSQDDEWDREYLAHVDGEGGFEGFLNLLGVFDEEAEGEDVG